MKISKIFLLWGFAIAQEKPSIISLDQAVKELLAIPTFKPGKFFEKYIVIGKKWSFHLFST